MPEFTYTEVTDEMTRLGFTYPNDDMFTENEIAAEIETLQDYNLTTEVARLNVKAPSSDTLMAFARLAGTLSGKVIVTHEALTVVRDTSAEERRRSALSNLKAKVNEKNRETARKSLRHTADHL
jgi:hypothetical protein